jgi:hypothetical protein
VPRQVLVRSPYPDAKHLVTIETGSRRRGEPQPTVTLAAYHTMNKGLHRTFSGVAFYQPIDARVGGIEITVAIASANLFDVLGVSPSIDPPRGVCLILSRGLWRKRFATDPRMAGRELSVAGQTAIVAGVIDDDWWRLPGRAEAWLLVDDAHLDALVSPHKGFAVGRLWPSAPQPRRRRLLGIFLPNVTATPSPVFRSRTADHWKEFWPSASSWPSSFPPSPPSDWASTPGAATRSPSACGDGSSWASNSP